MSSIEPELQLRPAVDTDADRIAEVHLASRRAAAPAMPPPVHSDAEVRSWLSERVRRDDVWVAELAGQVVGYARASPDWLDDLYVDPGHAGRGVGTALLDVVKAVRPHGFALWVFETNHPARRFYAGRGLVELEHTDGRDNEEGAPDVRMAWPGTDPIGYLRRHIDEVDDELAVVLSRRAALTRVVQRYKTVPGHGGRDPGREAEIARRMAARAPALTEEAWRRLVHELISVSLDAAD